MSAFQSLAPRAPASLETLHNIIGSLVARYRQEEVLTAVRQVPSREAKFRSTTWVTSNLAEAYRTKGIRELYSHQALTAELVRDGKNVVVVSPTASLLSSHLVISKVVKLARLAYGAKRKVSLNASFRGQVS